MIRTKAVPEVSREGEFQKLFCIGGSGTNGSLGGKVRLGRAKGWKDL